MDLNLQAISIQKQFFKELLEGYFSIANEPSLKQWEKKLRINILKLETEQQILEISKIKGMGRIKAFIYGRYGEGRILYSACSDRSQEKTVSQESEFVIGKLKEIKLVANERQKITLESTGAQFQWFCMCDSQDIIYLTICTLDYAERHAYQMIQDLRKHFLQISTDYGQESDSVLRMHGKNAAENLLIQYNSDNVDKIKQVQNKLNETKAGLQENLNLAIGNVGNLESTKEKSDKLQLQSQQLKNQAKDLESIMRWRNYKLNLIFFLIILGVVLYVIFGIVNN